MNDDKKWEVMDLGEDPKKDDDIYPSQSKDICDGVLMNNRWDDKEKRIMVNINVSKIWNWLKRKK